MTNQRQTSVGFSGLGIAPRLIGVIDKLKFVEPTPIQARSIPIGIEGKDIIAIAQTGTGKTLAFGIPIVQRLAQIKGISLILVPTRELALQVEQAISPFGHANSIRLCVLIGGASMNNQISALQKKPRIVIATPGRLIDHLEQKTISLSDTAILVLDEADRMLDMGFAPQLNRILKVVPSKRQTMLFSATMPTAIVQIAKQHMELPINVEIAPSGTTAEKVSQEVFFVSRETKTHLLDYFLQQIPGPVLVFTRTKHGARKLTRQVKALKHKAAEIHSDRSMAQRREALEGFKSGRFRILVATDIAARGIDVTGIELVVNYDLPSNSEDYVHRIGRTARAGRPGRAISFATFDQRGDIWNIEKVLRTALPISKLPESLALKKGEVAPDPEGLSYRPVDLPVNEDKAPSLSFGRQPKGSRSNRRPSHGRRR